MSHAKSSCLQIQATQKISSICNNVTLVERFNRPAFQVCTSKRRRAHLLSSAWEPRRQSSPSSSLPGSAWPCPRTWSLQRRPPRPPRRWTRSPQCLDFSPEDRFHQFWQPKNMLINLPHLCTAGSNLHIAGCTGYTKMRLQIYHSVQALLYKLKTMQLYLSNLDF